MDCITGILELKPKTAAATLATIRTKGRAPKTGYDRNEFGPAWLDADRNGCDTRNDILRMYLTHKKYKPRTKNCVVMSGRLKDTYTAKTIKFKRGSGNSIDIDHVVALSNGWQTGAGTWTIKKRAAFANDPLNLLPVDYSANRKKGDGDAATYKNCTAVRAAGKAPIRRGEPGYGSHLDRDGDGIGCE